MIRVASQLKELIGARAATLKAKIQVQEEMLRAVCPDDDAAMLELQNFKKQFDSYDSAYGEDGESSNPDAQVFLSQVQQT